MKIDYKLTTSELTRSDIWGRWKIRWGINRMGYTVDPGLYALGKPDKDSDVFVTANYKMSFDQLRSNLKSMNAWILVLDTKGINVWCAAGKGTFATKELVDRINFVNLKEIVSHRKIIVPQLGATGVSAHDVVEQCGFKVLFGPVRADDIPCYIVADYKATPEMRLVNFKMFDRMVLIPVELSGTFKYLFITLVAFLLLSGINSEGYSLSNHNFPILLLIVGSYIAGVALTPILLPWLPNRAFALKGAWAGLFVIVPYLLYLWNASELIYNWLHIISLALIILAISSFLSMSYTGSSTYTSLSGVKKEMKYAVPIQISFSIVGLGLWITSKFI